tara:strand:+ start:2592 stop:3962 length:1371 start_codon:yes stop_codon:yes gene_type:complete
MVKLSSIIAINIFVITVIFYYFWETIKLNWMIFMIVSRGIISPNRFWWSVSDLTLKDGSGIEFYRDIKSKYKKKITNHNFFGTKINLLMDSSFIKQLLDKSPNIFGVGRLKYNFFSSFMSKNLGVSEGKDWKHRRQVNEFILESDKLHSYSQHWYNAIKQIMNKYGKIPSNSDDFTKISKQITMKIVFGDDNINDSIFKVFSDANSIQAIYGIDITNKESMKEYIKYLKDSIDNPLPYSLVELGTQVENSKNEMIHQIPHFIFPIVGLVGVSVPRILLLLNNHPKVFKKLIKEIKSINGYNDVKSIWQLKYLRMCILEMLRLNNPVVTSYRTLLVDEYSFDDSEKFKYKKGDQFVILNNPVLREPEFWKDPDRFIPERWHDSNLEKSYYAIMFNQGPQKCPGKELAITIISIVVVEIISRIGLLDDSGSIKESYPKIDINKIPQMINPYSIRFVYG